MAFAALCLACFVGPRTVWGDLQAIESHSGGRLGVCAFEVGTGKAIGYRLDDRFLMCSTFKVLLVGCVLAHVDAGSYALSMPVHYGKADLLEYAPVTRKYVAQGELPVRALCEAAIELSDNTAANLLLRLVGGPAEVTAMARRLGDSQTRLDRIEPDLNHAQGNFDTTTPRSLAHSLEHLLFEARWISRDSVRQIEGWMKGCKTGLQDLRAGLPANWTVCDKTGSNRTMTNDIALVLRPHLGPIVIAATTTRQDGPPNREMRC